MPVGTSSGQYYDDDFDYHHSQIFENSSQPVTKNLPNPEGLERPKTVHIVRHGETTENKDNTVRGWEPVHLNDTGRKEAEEAADELKAKGVDTIVSSDLQRAKETALIIGAKLGIAPTFDPRLRTWDVGEHAGKPCETSNPVLKEYVKDKPDTPVPGGESFNDFTNRSFAGIRDAILNNKDKNLAIVTHNRVEGTLRGWEKTGQENPDIDVNEAIKETIPGNVKSIKFQPDATILNTFDDRFVGEPSKLPMDVSGYDLDKMPLNWWRTDLPRYYWPGDPNHPGRDPSIVTAPYPEQKDLDLYNPVMEDKLINKIIKEGGARSGGSGGGSVPRNLSLRVKPKYDSPMMRTAKDKDFSEAIDKEIDKRLPESQATEWETLPDGTRVRRTFMNPSQQQQGNASIPSESSKAPETIVSAAIRANGKVFTGAHHFEALDKIDAEHGEGWINKGDYKEGFLTSTGRFVDRTEAGRIHGHKNDVPLLSEEVPSLK